MCRSLNVAKLCLVSRIVIMDVQWELDYENCENQQSCYQTLSAYI